MPLRPIVHLVAAALLITACGSGTTDETQDASLAGVPSDAPVETSTSAPTTTDAAKTATSTASDSEPDSSTTTTPGATATPSTATPSTTPTAPQHRYAPAPGTYRYTVTGYEESAGPTGSQRSNITDTASDTVTLADHGGHVTITTRSVDSQGEQTTVVSFGNGRAHLERLRHVPNGLGVTYDVHPDPPALVARLPYIEGQTWEIAWNDPSSGIQGVGTGRVLSPETIGKVDTAVTRIEQRLRGVITGQLIITTWTDPSTGTVIRQQIITDLEDAAGASRTDLTKTLLEEP